MQKIDAWFHIGVLVAGAVAARALDNPWLFLIGYIAFAQMPRDVSSRRRSTR